MKTFENSKRLFERASKVIPGAAQTGSKAPGRVGPLGAFPLFLEQGYGGYVRCVDGHRYVDWFNGNCAVTLGHGHQAVVDAVAHAVRYGSLLSLPTSLEADVAERLVKAIPCAEQLRFVKTGSEACAAAIRIARIATGRHEIAVCRGHYHGWHDWTMARNDFAPGVPEFMKAGVTEFRYNDLNSLRELFEGDGFYDVNPELRPAAVMLEPTLLAAPEPGFLEGVLELAHKHGALVIFDEMITGARWALGGAQQFFGVTPDLATFGKAFGNGLPIAFVAGRADLMRHAWPISGTFGGELTGLAACQAVLREYEQASAILRMWDVGQRLIDGMNEICRRRQVPARMIGYPARPALVWDITEWDDDVHDELLNEDLKPIVVALFQQELAQNGVLAHPSGWNPSAAHDSLALEQTLVGVDQALSVVAAAIASENPRSFLRGELLLPAFVRKEPS